MVRALGIRVPAREAEATRRRLLDEGTLRTDLKVARQGADVVFPVQEGTTGAEPAEFQEHRRSVGHYTELLDWPAERRAAAPRAYDQLGDLVIVKVAPDLWEDRAAIGEALLTFHRSTRAVFHDHGVKGEFRTRDLERLAGVGGTRTQVRENGVQLWVDVAAAYYSPRLGMERARVAAQLRPGDHVVDLFGGVAPFGVQAAKAGATVDTVDLNPAAIELARLNVKENRVADQVTVHLGDAREIAASLPAGSADHVVMNLPHGAKHFLAQAAHLVAPGGIIHHHEILDRTTLDERVAAIQQELAGHGCPVQLAETRVVRTYSPQEDHMAIDLRRTID
ncbi:MAG: class I SAM-dependent methyltransferase [Thermoplasmatota archaeon]